MEQFSVLKSIALIFFFALIFIIYIYSGARAQTFSNKDTKPTQVPVEEKVDIAPAEVVKQYYSNYSTCIKNQQDLDIFPDSGTECNEVTRNFISDSFLETIKKKEKLSENPIICSRYDPHAVTVENAAFSPDTARVLVTISFGSLERRTIVDLSRKKQGWLVDDITCQP